jgi:hypothetical protein
MLALASDARAIHRLRDFDRPAVSPAACCQPDAHQLVEWALLRSWKRCGTVDADRILHSMKEKLELLPKLLPFMVALCAVRRHRHVRRQVWAPRWLAMVIVIIQGLEAMMDLWAILRDGLPRIGHVAADHQHFHFVRLHDVVAGDPVGG